MSPRGNWLAGLTVGAWAGFFLVYFPVVGAVLFLGFTIGAAIGRSLEAMAGLLVGAGAAILLMLALANSNCQSGCTPPDLTGFVVVGSAMALIGAALTLRIIRRSRRI